MAITAGTLRLTTANRPKPGAMATAITAPGPVAISAGSTVDGGSVPLAACDSSNRLAYWGYAIKACAANDQPTLANGAIVEGFAGCTQGSLVYVADDGSLSHTEPTGLEKVTAGVSALATVNATTALNLIVPAGATKLTALKIAVKTAVAAHASNIWTFACANKGDAGDGTTAMLAATAANTTTETTGFSLAAYVAHALTLHATPANLAVTAGQVLEISATKAASAGDLVELAIMAEFDTAQVIGDKPVGLAVRTTAIFFFDR